MAVTTVAAGANAALVFDFPAGDVTDAQITITPSAGPAVVGPTSAGIGAAGDGRYTYVWSVPADTTPGTYTATVDGTDGADPVDETVTIAVTGLPVYATLAAIRKSRGVTSAAEDDTLLDVLNAASRAIDTRTGRRFYLDETAVTRTFRPRGRTLRRDCGDELLLIDDVGSAADLVVEVGSGSSWTAVTDYETDPDNAIAKGRPITGLARPTRWAYGPTRIRIAARWGWPAVPEEIRQATLIQANRLYMRKDTPEGVKTSADWGAIRMSRVDPDVEAMITPYILPGFA